MVEENLSNQKVIVAGRLSAFLSRWSEITSDRVILQTIAGYRLPFTQHPPPQINEPLIQLSNLEQQICHQEVSRLLEKGTIELVSDSEGQFLSPYFAIKKSSGGWRFILNLKRLNRFVDTPHFKIENWKNVICLLSPENYLASIDLEDAYFLISINPDDRKFLRFSFQSRLYQFRVLLFGLASAPYIFTKILKPVLHSLRNKGLFSVAYLDDFLLIAHL